MIRIWTSEYSSQCWVVYLPASHHSPSLSIIHSIQNRDFSFLYKMTSTCLPRPNRTNLPNYEGKQAGHSCRHFTSHLFILDCIKIFHLHTTITWHCTASKYSHYLLVGCWTIGRYYDSYLLCSIPQNIATNGSQFLGLSWFTNYFSCLVTFLARMW